MVSDRGILDEYGETYCNVDYAEDCPDWCRNPGRHPTSIIGLCLKSCASELYGSCDSELLSPVCCLMIISFVSVMKRTGKIAYPTYGCGDLRSDCRALRAKGYCDFAAETMSECSSVSDGCGYCLKCKREREREVETGEFPFHFCVLLVEKYFPLRWERLRLFGWLRNYHNAIYRRELEDLERNITWAKQCLLRLA